jgi:hypothetical protein
LDKMKALLVLLVIIISLAFTPIVEAAKWVYWITDKESNKWYYDSESITYPAKGTLRVWEKTIYSEAGRKSLEKDIGTKPSDISKTKALYEFNCTKRKFRITNSIAFNSSDKVVSKGGDKIRDWQAIHPETLIEFLYNEVCKKDKP